MTTLSTVYATDEDIALRVAADFSILCPKDQKLAAGVDGVFDSSDRWTLRSASVDFSNLGPSAGQVVLLTKPIASFKPQGEALAIVSTAPGAVTLRRKGLLPQVGQPPAPSSGLAGVEFSITTLGPQIEDASYSLNRRFGIDDLVAGRQASSLYDPREVREATVLTVLCRQYLSLSREAGQDGDGFAAKAAAFKQELDDLLARAELHWKPANATGNTELSTSRFSTRLVR